MDFDILIRKICEDASNIRVTESKNIVIFESQGADKRVKTCYAKFDNLGIKVVVKQIDRYKPVKIMINGYPISNCKIIYER